MKKAIKALLKPLLGKISTKIAQMAYENLSLKSTILGMEVLLRKELLGDYKIMDAKESIDFLVKNKQSFIRIGDGEIVTMAGRGGGFHRQNKTLTDELNKIYWECLKSGIAVGLNPVITRNAANFQREEGERKFCLTQKISPLDDVLYAANVIPTFDVLRLISSEHTHFDAVCFRYSPLYFYTNYNKNWQKLSQKEQENATEQVKNNPRFYIENGLGKEMMAHYKEVLIEPVKRLWSGKCVIICEGKNSYFGVYNDLFSSAFSVERLSENPPQNAYDAIEQTFNAAKNLAVKLKAKHPSKEICFVLALGHAAKILTYRLDKEGYKAYDLGNFSITYDCFLYGADTRAFVDVLNVDGYALRDYVK